MSVTVYLVPPVTPHNNSTHIALLTTDFNREEACFYSNKHKIHSIHLESFNDVAVVSGGGQNGISSRSITNGQSPAEGCFLHYVVGLHEQIIHLTVQIHRNGYGSAFGCTIQNGKRHAHSESCITQNVRHHTTF